MEYPAQKLYTPHFLLLCLSTFLFFGSFNMIIVELPERLEGLGGAAYKGWIITLFTITAGISRPFSGKLADTIGRIPVIFIGIAVSLVCTMAYPFVETVFIFLLLRLGHGFSTGFTPTGNSAYVADIVPVSRRGEGLGMIGFSGSLAMSGSPVLGSYLTQTFSFDAMIGVSALITFFALVILFFLPETLQKRQKFTFSLLKLSPSAIIEPSALSAGVVMVLLYLAFGMMLILSPDLSEHWDLGNKGFLMMIATVAAMAARLVGGKASDRYGREIVLKVGGLGLAFGLFLMGMAQSAPQIIAATAIFGIFMGLAPPVIYAWAIDTAPEDRRAQALATVYIALEIGIGVGSWLGMALYDNKPAQFAWAFWAASAASLGAVVFLMFRKTQKIKI